MPSPRINTPTEQNKEDNSLILYRIDRVEAAVKEVGSKVDKQDNLKRSDLMDLKTTFIERTVDIRDNLQKQIDVKADQSGLDDVKTLLRAFAAVFGSVIAGLIIYYITNGKR